MAKLNQNSKKHNIFLERQGPERALSGKQIKEIRKAYNLSQKCFAELLGISIDTLQNYEIERYKPSSAACSLFLLAKENMSLFQTKYSKNINNRSFMK
jgi:DNA-binding transcriptional regulator YiaG